MPQAASISLAPKSDSPDRPPRANALAHVVAILPRGEAIRNFVYSGALEKLADNATLTALAVKPNEAIWARVAEHCGAVHELLAFPNRYPVRILREIIEVCHTRWLWSQAAQERWRLRDLEAQTSLARVKRLAKKLLVIPFANRSGLRILERVERSASRLLRASDHYLDLYRQLRPTLVFNASHVHSSNAIHAVEAAQWLGIPTATFIFSWDNLTSQGRVLPAYDYYLVWSDQIKQQLLGIYNSIRPNQVFVTGTPQFDSHFRSTLWDRQEFCRRVGADPRRPIVMYATGMPNHMPGEDHIVEQIADMLTQMNHLGPPQLLVRVYAKDRSGRFNPLKRRRPDILFPEVPWEPNWLTPKPEDLPLWTNTLRHCALGINVASTVSLELCMFDKPVINVSYNPPSLQETTLSYARYYQFDHYAPVVASGAVQLATSPEAMSELIKQALENPSKASANRRHLLRQMFADTLDGRCGSRAAEVLAGIASTTPQKQQSPSL